MLLGLALPQYDYSLPKSSRGGVQSSLEFSAIADYARVAQHSGFDSIWLSDHLFLDLAKYGGPPDRHGCFEPIATLSALARVVSRVRLGTLVLCEALRPASVLAKALASLDRVSDGRLDVGIGAGWYAPEYEALGMDLPSPRERLERLTEAVEVVKGMLAGGPFTFDGKHHRTVDARNLPPAIQQPRPRVFVGGSGDRLLGLVAAHADGWNTCWKWTPDSYRDRLRVLDAACERVDRDPATVWRTLGLYALCGEDQTDLERRFERLRADGPPGVLDGVDLTSFRTGRLVGTVEEVREQVAVWDELGVDTVIAGVGAVPFQVGTPDDVELLAHAIRPG